MLGAFELAWADLGVLPRHPYPAYIRRNKTSIDDSNAETNVEKVYSHSFSLCSSPMAGHCSSETSQFYQHQPPLARARDMYLI